MKLFFQCGYGLKALSKQLTATFADGTYILSPRDLPQKSQLAFSRSLRQKGNRTLFDPQLYAPHSDKKNFPTYAYWPKGFVTAEAPWNDLVGRLAALNEALGTVAVILPGMACERVGSQFLRLQEAILDAAVGVEWKNWQPSASSRMSSSIRCRWKNSSSQPNNGRWTAYTSSRNTLMKTTSWTVPSGCSIC